MLWTLLTSLSRQRPQDDKPEREGRFHDQDFMAHDLDLESSKALKTVTVWFDDQGLMTATEVTKTPSDDTDRANETRMAP